MHFYKTPPNIPFLDNIANFISQNFSLQSLSKLKVILPNGFTCLSLQRILVKKYNITILPNIVPFSNISAEGLEIFEIPSEYISQVTVIEKKLILTEIIHNYPGVITKDSWHQSLQFCSLVTKFLDELLSNNIAKDKLAALENSHYWQSAYRFLEYVYLEWHERLKKLKKQDNINYQIKMLEAEIARINRLGENVIIAGILGHDHISWNFLKNVASAPSAFIILPPIGEFETSLLQGDAGKDGLYCLVQLLKYLGKDLTEFKIIGGKQEDYSYSNSLNRLLINQSKHGICDKKLEIKLLEFNTIYDEAQQLALICKDNPNKQIAIIVNNEKTKYIYYNFLAKYSIEFQDLIGHKLLYTHICQLIISISEIICNEFDLKKLFLLLKNPLINSKLERELELVFSGKNRFVKNPKQMLTIVEATGDTELIAWFHKLVDLLYKHNDNEILTNSIKIAEKLYKDIWYEQGAVEAAKFFSQLLEFKSNLIFSDKKDLPAIFRTLLGELQYFSPNDIVPNIFIGKPSDLALITFDLVILADFNEENWPLSIPKNPWLNSQMQTKLALDSNNVHLSMSLYYFYLFLHNKRVIITRANKQPSKTGISPSKYLLKLQAILGRSLIRDENQHNSLASENRPVSPAIPSLSIGCDRFPNILSITDIELLIRNPYSFYVKKILNLGDKEKIGMEPKNSEFGNYIHKIFDLYTKNYVANQDKDKIQCLLKYGADILQNISLPEYTVKIWQIKLIPIARAFIEFDQQRRLNTTRIYSEARGELKLNIAEQELTIVGVADRIEIDKYGKISILDYKTGTLPSKKDIESGLSPQLIILALIALEGGFFLDSLTHILHEIIYVKLASSQPYIQITEVNLTKQMLIKHKQGLVELIKYYLTTKNFSKEIDLLQYNPYSHLARKA